MAIASNDLLTKFHVWADAYKDSFMLHAGSVVDPLENKETIQGDVFWEDLSRGVSASGRGSAYTAATLVQSLAVVPLSLIAPFGEVYRAASKEISFSTCLSHIATSPKHVFFAVFEIIALVGRSLSEVSTGAETGTGFVAWHSAEWLVRSVVSRPDSVLSQLPAARNFVYISIGSPLLALGGVFVPIASVQVMALAVLSSRIFEIVNSLLGMQDCPAYYEAIEHVIRTNHWLIKPLVVRSETVTIVSKIAAPIFALIHVLPYFSKMLPISLIASSMFGCCLGGLVMAQLASMTKKRSLEKTLEEYTSLVGMEWNKDLLEKTWEETADARGECALKKGLSITQSAKSDAEYNIFNAKCKRWAETISKAADDCDFPAKELFGFQAPRIPISKLASWRACWERERVGTWMLAAASLTALAVSIMVRRQLHLKAILQRYD